MPKMHLDLPSIYSSAAGEEALRRHYEATLASLPTPATSEIVHTRFGNAHVLICGPKDAPCLMLWQGTAAPGPFMLFACQELMKHYRVYVPDVPCQAGSRSDPAHLDPFKNGHGVWCMDVIHALVLHERPLLHVGISLGGALIMDIARVDPSLISAAALLVPASLHPDCTSLPYALSLVFKVMLPMTVYKYFPNRRTRSAAFAAMFEEFNNSDNPCIHQQELAFQHVAWFPPPPRKVEKEELEEYYAPTLVMSATRDVFGGGEATAMRALEVFHECEVEVIDSAHVFSTEQMKQCQRRIIEFFSKHGYPGV